MTVHKEFERMELSVSSFTNLDLTLISEVEIWTPTPYFVVFLTGN
jgi:hypothetical protein